MVVLGVDGLDLIQLAEQGSKSFFDEFHIAGIQFAENGKATFLKSNLSGRPRTSKGVKNNSSDWATSAYAWANQVWGKGRKVCALVWPEIDRPDASAVPSFVPESRFGLNGWLFHCLAIEVVPSRL